MVEVTVVFDVEDILACGLRIVDEGMSNEGLVLIEFGPHVPKSGGHMRRVLVQSLAEDVRSFEYVAGIHDRVGDHSVVLLLGGVSVFTGSGK